MPFKRDPNNIFDTEEPMLFLPPIQNLFINLNCVNGWPFSSPTGSFLLCLFSLAFSVFMLWYIRKVHDLKLELISLSSLPHGEVFYKNYLFFPAQAKYWLNWNPFLFSKRGGWKFSKHPQEQTLQSATHIPEIQFQLKSSVHTPFNNWPLPGWQDLAGFRRGQTWPWNLSSSA